jgi:hypothetical protein
MLTICSTYSSDESATIDAARISAACSDHDTLAHELQMISKTEGGLRSRQLRLSNPSYLVDERVLMRMIQGCRIA